MEIFVAKGSVMDKSLQLTEDQQLHITIEEGAHLQLLLEGTDCQLTTEVVVGKGAMLDLCDLGNSSANASRTHDLHIRQEANSSVFVQSISLSAGNARNTTSVDFCGEGAELNLNGLVMADHTQRVENHTLVNHQVPHCTSHQIYKYVLDDQAVGTYAGLVKVEPGAHHTHSEQTNRNLCLTREARMFAQPQLEIYNDDVRCNHGATVGQLDETALFYMQQRGIPKREARMLLMFAFLGEVADTVRVPALRERLHTLIEKRLRIQ